jgi:hypothetical protein
MIENIEKKRKSKENVEQNEKNINSDSMFKDLFGN